MVRSESYELINVLQQNAEFKKKKKEVEKLLNKIEVKVINYNKGYSISVIDELLGFVKDQIEQISPKHEHLLESVHLRLEEILDNNYESLADYEDYISAKLFAIKDFLDIYDNLISFQNEYLNESIILASKKLDLELKKIRELRNSLQNVESENIYTFAVEKFNKNKNFYFGVFLFTMVFTVILSFSTMVAKNKLIKIFEIDIYDYWLLKFTMISLLITLISFLLRQVIHYQKKSDYAEKISLELQAFPSYISDLSPDDSVQLRKELALKYFGNDQTHNPNNELNSIYLEQMKATTEMVKVSTETVKNLKT